MNLIRNGHVLCQAYNVAWVATENESRGPKSVRRTVEIDIVIVRTYIGSVNSPRQYIFESLPWCDAPYS